MKEKEERMFDLKLSNVAKRFLVKCDKVLYERLVIKLKDLQHNPFPSDVKRVKGRVEKIFRVRVGDYRILYLVIKEKNLLFVSDIDKRSKIYY